VKTARQQQKKTPNSAQKTVQELPAGGPPTPVEQLRRLVTVQCCRIAIDIDSDASVAEFVKSFAEEECFLGDDGVLRAKRIWYLRYNGTVGLSQDCLEILARKVKDIEKFHDHVFWRLIELEELTVDELLDVIKDLPPPIAEQLLLADPNRTDGSLIPDFQTFRFDGLRFLGDIDGVAGLLAFGLLCERAYQPAAARQAMHAAVRLLGRIYASISFLPFMDELWNILKPGLLDRLAPGDFEDRGKQQAWMWMSDSYEQIWEALSKYGVLPAENHRTFDDIMKLADCAHLNLLANAASVAWQDKIIENPAPLPEPLALLTDAYREYIALREAHTSPELFYPIQLLNRLDRALGRARPRWETDREARKAVSDPLVEAFWESVRQAPVHA
jgi:hypothetical protein